MLGSKIHSVMPDLAILSDFSVVWGEVHVFWLIGIYRVAEALVDRNEASAGLFSSLVGGGSIMARGRACDRSSVAGMREICA